MRVKRRPHLASRYVTHVGRPHAIVAPLHLYVPDGSDLSALQEGGGNLMVETARKSAVTIGAMTTPDKIGRLW